MSSKQNRTRKPAADSKVEAPVISEEQGTEQLPQSVATAEPAATIAAEKPAPVEKKGKSTIQYPVAYVWMTCINMIAAAAAAGQPKPTRTSMVNRCIADGVAFYTSRTQVQAYLKASQNGTQVPAKLPKGLNIKPAAPAEPTA